MSDSFLNLVRKGIAAVTQFNYDGTLISIRAVSSSEMDDAKYKSIDLCDDKLAGLILRIRLGQLKGTKFDMKEVPVDLYKNYLKYILEFDYWVAYYGMKDFRDQSFTIDDVKKMRYVHDIANTIISISSAPTDIIIEFVKTSEGKELAKIVYEFHQPLVSDAWKLTPLQHEFLTWSHPNAPKHIANSIEELEKVLPAMGDMMKHGRAG